jgi:aryl sulfotransferase
MPTLVRQGRNDVRSRIFDSARWENFKAHEGDIIVATFPKCGTTWTQRIVAMLLAGSAEPMPMQIPWPDMRLGPPVEAVLAMADAVPGRRQLKTHLPYDAIPIYDDMKIIHVARDGRDSAMSFHNHMIGFTPFALEGIAAINTADPKFGSGPPPTAENPADYFGVWLQDGGAFGDPACSYWHMERSYWAERANPNVLMVHYNDLKADRGGEMRRIAAFLGITLPETVWPSVIEAASFDSMKSQGETLMPGMTAFWDHGSQRFLHKGTNGRWKGVVSDADLAAYDAAVEKEFTPALAAWLEGGRLVAGDPRNAPD